MHPSPPLSAPAASQNAAGGHCRRAQALLAACTDATRTAANNSRKKCRSESAFRRARQLFLGSARVQTLSAPPPLHRSPSSTAGSRSGVHINAIGANHAHKRELDDEAVASADVIVVDSIEQSARKAGDLIMPSKATKSVGTAVKKTIRRSCRKGQRPHQ